MSNVAEQLREAREKKNLTVYQVAESTKIHTDHIRALDEGNFDVFSAPVYVRGFVRNYATFLKLDVASVMQQLNSELSKSEKHHEHPPLTQKPKGLVDFLMFQLSRVNWRIALPVIFLTLIIFIAAFSFRAWKNHQAKDPLANLGAGVYQPIKKQDGEMLPLPTPRR